MQHHEERSSPTSTSGASLAGAALRGNRRFNLLLSAAGVSSLGDGVRTAALPLLATTLTTDPLVLSAVAVASRMPWLLVSLLSGAIADRVNRVRLMMWVNALRGAVVLGLALFVAVGGASIVVLYVVAFALGVAETLFDSASEGILPTVVPKHQLGDANGRLSTATMIGGDFIGPSLGSFTFAVARSVPFLLDGLSFLASSLLVSRLPATRPLAAEKTRNSVRALAREMAGEVRDGMRWVAGSRLIRSFQLIGFLVNLTQSATQALLVLLVTTELNLAPSAFGVLLTISGVGAALGAAVSGWAGSRMGAHRVLLPAIASTIPIFVVMAWSDSFIWLGIALAANGFFGVLAGIQMATVRQHVVPNELLGRVVSVSRFLTYGIAVPAGAALGGVLATVAGVRSVYWASAAVMVVTIVLVLRQIWPTNLKRAIDESTLEGTS